MVSESSNTAAFIVSEEFEIEEGSSTTWEATKNSLPSSLVLVAVCELDVDMLEWD